jgi:hypothetical protein
MRKLSAVLLVLLGAVSLASAATPVGGVPEIDPGSLLSASALVGAAVFMIRGRRKP